MRRFSNHFHFHFSPQCSLELQSVCQAIWSPLSLSESRRCPSTMIFSRYLVDHSNVRVNRRFVSSTIPQSSPVTLSSRSILSVKKQAPITRFHYTCLLSDSTRSSLSVSPSYLPLIDMKSSLHSARSLADQRNDEPRGDYFLIFPFLYVSLRRFHRFSFLLNCHSMLFSLW